MTEVNLIDRLGGYSKAVSLFKGCPWESGIVDVPNPRSKGMIRLDLSNLADELLEYRRKHNIFEVGDRVVCMHENLHLFGDVVLEIRCFRYDLKTIGNFVRFTNGNDYRVDVLRHATDEEVKTGRRL